MVHPRDLAVPGVTGVPPGRHRHQPDPRALVHGLRHTFATEHANVYTLMNLPGHESISTSQRYVTTTGRETGMRISVGWRRNADAVAKLLAD